MKIAINAGHTITGIGAGAVELLKESEETRKIVKELAKLLKNRNHTIVDCTVDVSYDYLKEVVNIANLNKCNLFLSIHLNAGGGNGTEIYTWAGEQITMAKQMLSQFQKLGFKNRGIKDGSDLYVIKHTNMVAILIEVCFLDSKKDCATLKKVGYKRIAQAISNCI